MSTLFWCVLAAEVVFVAGLAVCVAVVPSYVLGPTEGGVSNFGSDGRTAVPFSVSFGGNALAIAAAAWWVPSTAGHPLWLTTALALLAMLLTLVLVSAWVYKRNTTLRTMHFSAGIALLAYEALFGLWLALSFGSTWVVWPLWIALVAGDAVCVLALTHIFEKLFVGQVVANVAFGALLLTVLA